MEEHEVALAASELAVVEHHADEVDPPDVEVSVAVVEVAAVAVAFQEAADAVVVALVAADEEDTKFFGLGRRSPRSGHAGEALPFALPFLLEPTITLRYHDHLSAFWSCDGITVTCRKYGALLRTF